MVLSPEHEAFGAALRQLREEAGLSQAALAKRIGSTQPYVSALENGQRNPALTVVFRLGPALQRPFADLAAAYDSRHPLT